MNRSVLPDPKAFVHRPKVTRLRSLVAVFIGILALESVLAIRTLAAAEPTVSYFRDIRPIFQQNCQGCHQPAKAQGAYIMTDFANLLKGGETGQPAIVPGKPDASYLMDEIRVHADGSYEMPKNREALSPKQIQLIEQWIREGAADDTPVSARETVTIDEANPHRYTAPPVITALAFSPDGKLLAVNGYHEVLLHSADGSRLEGRLIGLAEQIRALAFSPDGEWLAAAGGSPGRFGEVQIWNVAKRKLRVSIPTTFDTVFNVSWSPDGRMVATGGTDNVVRAFDSSTGQQVLQMGTHSDWVLGTVFSQDGKHLVSVSRDMSMKLTEVPTQRFVDNITSITPGALKGGLMTVDRRPMAEKKLQAIPSDTPGAKPNVYDELIVAGSDGVPRLYKMHREKKREIGDDANKIAEFAAMPGRISCVRFDATGARFAAVSSSDGRGEVRVYDIASTKPVTCEKITGPVYAVAWHPDAQTLASAGFDGTIWLHDPATGKLKSSFVAVPLQPSDQSIATK